MTSKPAAFLPSRVIIFACLLTSVSYGASAQEKFPSRTIEVVTHSGVGGGTDTTARMMMVEAPGAFGQELVVSNRVGGSGAAALAYANSRPKDGHTILLITQTHLLTLLQGKGGDVKGGDLIAVARAMEDPQILLVGKNSPYKTAKEFLDAAKTKSMKYGTSHIGSIDHLAVVGFAEAAKMANPTIIPFRGGGDININLVAGNIDASLSNYAESETQIQAGGVRPLLVLADEKLSALPNVATAKEVGINAKFTTTRGFAVLKGTPEDRIKALEAGLTKAMTGKLFQAYLVNSGQSPKSVVGHAEYQAQIDEFMRTGKETLAKIGVQ